jgi:putative ABC transport system ATP-binding protein
VFQALNLIPTMTTREKFRPPARLAADVGWLDHVVATVGLGDRLEHGSSEPSGGRRQRSAVALHDLQRAGPPGSVEFERERS